MATVLYDGRYAKGTRKGHTEHGGGGVKIGCRTRRHAGKGAEMTNDSFLTLAISLFFAEITETTAVTNQSV